MTFNRTNKSSVEIELRIMDISESEISKRILQAKENTDKIFFTDKSEEFGVYKYCYTVEGGSGVWHDNITVENYNVNSIMSLSELMVGDSFSIVECLQGSFSDMIGKCFIVIDVNENKCILESSSGENHVIMFNDFGYYLVSLI